MHPASQPDEHLDAIYFSPHKFLGGPGTSGVLVFSKRLYANRVPDNPAPDNPAPDNWVPVDPVEPDSVLAGPVLADGAPLTAQLPLRHAAAADAGASRERRSRCR